jgi:hypothetical protein
MTATRMSVKTVLENLEDELKKKQEDLEWYYQKFKYFEEHVLALKETIADLKACIR